MGLWIRRLLAVILDLVIGLSLALGLVRLAGVRVPATADFLLSLAVVALVPKAVFVLDEGLVHGLGRLRRGPAATWDRAVFGWLYRRRAAVALGTIVTLLLLGAVEIGLRLALPVLPSALANELARAYSIGGDGIYTEDRNLKVMRMRPNYRRPMFFSGYRWTHQTDALGFRNPATLTQADVVLLGDSMIYGHGVEEPQTVASHLRADTGRSVANLGQQGIGIHEEYQFLMRYGRPLKPRWVFLFLLNNDLDDTTVRLSAEDQQRAVDLPDDDPAAAYVTPREPSRRSALRQSVEDWLGKFYVVRARDFVAAALRAGRRRTSLYRPSTKTAALTPNSPAAGIRLQQVAWRAPGEPWAAVHAGEVEPFLSRPELGLALRFQAKLLRRMRLVAARDGFEFAVIYLNADLPFDDVFTERFGAICREEGIRYHDFGAFYQREEAAGRRLFLPRDGHFTDEGARMTARELVRLYPALAEPKARP